MRTLPLLVLSALLVLASAACDLPRDPRGTLARVGDGGVLRVGAAPAAPFTILRDGREPAGPEPELVRRLADRLDARVAWTEAPAHELATALEAGVLDLVIGGLPRGERSGPGASRPWTRTRITLGTSDEPGPADEVALQGLRVRAERGSVAAGIGRRQGATVEEVEDLRYADPPVLAPAWKLRALGLVPAPLALHETPRVLLVRSGENGFLMTLDRFLHEHEEWARERLERAARGQGVP